MAFYSPDAAMGQRLSSLVEGLAAGEGCGVPASQLAITWLRYPRSLRAAASAAAARSAPARRSDQEDGALMGRGASWRGDQGQDPGALVQLPYLVAVERWLQRDLLIDGADLRRALAAMVRQGCLEATSHLVDVLSGTTSGPSLPPERQLLWERQRELVNGWLASLGWPELQGCRACQKLWAGVPYGREQASLREDGANGNSFSSEGLARLLQGVMADSLVSPPACARMRDLLRWGPDQGDGDGPRPSPLGALLPPEARLWGLVASRSLGGGLALYGEVEGQEPFLVVLLDAQAAAQRGGAASRAGMGDVRDDGTAALLAALLGELLS